MTTNTQAEATVKKHTLSVLVSHNMNAFSRIIGIFSGKGFEVDSVSFGTDRESGMSRITLTTSGEEHVIEQITKQLNKVVDVVKVADLTYEYFMERELALIKVATTSSNRSEVMQIAQVFKGKIVDISPEKLSVEVTGNRDKIDAVIGMLRPFGISELARTGSVALKREYNGKT